MVKFISKISKKLFLIRGKIQSSELEYTIDFIRHLYHISGVSKKKLCGSIVNAKRLLHALGRTKQTSFIGYTELQFNHQHEMMGAKFIAYLMDASPITNSSLSLFPIFYTLFDPLASSRDKAIWKLDKNTMYHYMGNIQDPVFTIKEFKSILEGFKVKRHKIDSILDLLAAILHLGNLEFKDLGSGMCSLRPGPHLQTACELLSLPDCSLLLNLFCSRSFQDEHGLHHEPLSPSQASHQRDKFVHLLYESVFEYILDCINVSLCADESKWSHYIAFLEVPIHDIGATRVGLSSLLNHFSCELLREYVFDEFIQQTQKIWERDSLGSLNEPVERNQDLLEFFQEILLPCLEYNFNSITNVKESSIFKIVQDGLFQIEDVIYDIHQFDLKNYSHVIYELKKVYENTQKDLKSGAVDIFFLKDLILDFDHEITFRQKQFPSLKRIKPNQSVFESYKGCKWVSQVFRIVIVSHK